MWTWAEPLLRTVVVGEDSFSEASAWLVMFTAACSTAPPHTHTPWGWEGTLGSGGTEKGTVWCDLVPPLCQFELSLTGLLSYLNSHLIKRRNPEQEREMGRVRAEAGLGVGG